MAEPRARARALDQPRDVGDHELALVALERPQHRLDRREGIVGDLRLRARQPGEQRRLARVRQPHQPGVGQQPAAAARAALLAGQSAFGEARALPRGRCELLVAAPAAAAAGHERALARVQRGPSGRPAPGPRPPCRAHAHLERLGRRAVLVRPLAVTAALRLEVRAAAEGREVAQRRIGRRRRRRRRGRRRRRRGRPSARAPRAGTTRRRCRRRRPARRCARGRGTRRARRRRPARARHVAVPQPRDQLPVVGEEPGRRQPLQQLDPAGLASKACAGSARPPPRGRSPRGPRRARRRARGCRAAAMRRLVLGERPCIAGGGELVARVRPRVGAPQLDQRRSSPTGSGWSSTRRSRAGPRRVPGRARRDDREPPTAGRGGRRPRPRPRPARRAGARLGPAAPSRRGHGAGTVSRSMMSACAQPVADRVARVGMQRAPVCTATRPPRSTIATWRTPPGVVAGAGERRGSALALAISSRPRGP